MAGAALKKAGRSSYAAAGYMPEDMQELESSLYIERVQAGSAHDLLRDNNRIGYSEEALDEDGLPFSFLMEELDREERKEKKQHRSRQLTFTERLARAVRRERGAAALCGVLLVLNMFLLSFWGQAMIDGVRKQDTISMYERGAGEYQREIDQAKMQIARAQDGERIRNVAQNELGMLRKERVATEKIYIHAVNASAAKPAMQLAEENGGLLDWLLSVADIFDFKS